MLGCGGEAWLMASADTDAITSWSWGREPGPHKQFNTVGDLLKESAITLRRTPSGARERGVWASWRECGLGIWEQAFYV